MPKRYFLIALAIVLALSVAMPAVGAPSPSKLAKKAFGLAKKADKRSKKALKVAKKIKVGPQGEQGPAGPQGARGPEGPAGPAGHNGKDGAPGQIGTRGRSCIEELGLDSCRGPKGQNGPPGLRGPKGDNGVAHTKVYAQSGPGNTTVFAGCPDDMVAVGGSVNSSNSSRGVGRSQPGEAGGSGAESGDQPKGWVGKVSGSNAAETTTVFAICAG